MQVGPLSMSVFVSKLFAGRVLLNKQLEGKEYMTRLNLDGFPSGSYFVKVVTKNQSGIAKLVITN